MNTIEKLSEERLKLLHEAMEMLEDMKVKMAMFERQHYSKFKARVESHKQLNTCLHQVFNGIKVSDE
ncbi:hypothetical protein ACFQZX_06385 [Mucilaginibacter litoreus]|uniref:50S ribosomal protein L29 n=1 Tax=Mucilaginibacter litoreus TaxID=1048221 RepID=A0ABW3AQG0_9SPHI